MFGAIDRLSSCAPKTVNWSKTQFVQKKNALALDKIRPVNDFDTNTLGAQAKMIANSKGSAYFYAIITCLIVK